MIEERQSEFMVFLDEFRLFDCNWKCLTDCPIPDGNCYWDDPDIGEPIEYPEYTFWRWDHEELVRKEPKNPMTTRCPRCYSTKIIIGYPYIQCQNCGYNEPLIDSPISRYYHLALESSMTRTKVWGRIASGSYELTKHHSCKTHSP